MFARFNKSLQLTPNFQAKYKNSGGDAVQYFSTTITAKYYYLQNTEGQIYSHT